MATVESLRAELGSVAQRLVLSETHGIKMAEELDRLRKETDAARKAANARINETGQRSSHAEDKLDLVDIKTMQPQVFSGHASESYKPWAKKVKAFCNAPKPVFRKALDWAEMETAPIDEASLGVLSWAPAVTADQKLYDMLVLHLSDDPLILVENHQG